MMRISKKVVLVSEDEELYRAFRRALRAVGDITVFKFTEDSLKNKRKIILLLAVDENNLQEWFYGRIRGAKYLNPVMVIGFEEEKQFKKKHPLFDDHPYNHVYIKAPFNLLDFVNLLNDMVPISSQSIRKAICGGDSGYKGYLLKLLSHDLLKDRERCIEILLMACNYVKDKKLAKEARESIKVLREKEGIWHTIAFEIGKRLEIGIEEDCCV